MEDKEAGMTGDTPSQENTANPSRSRSSVPLQLAFASLRGLRCPICSKRFDPAGKGIAMPFCSARCKQIDLGRWLGEEYGLPCVKSEGDEDDEA